MSVSDYILPVGAVILGYIALEHFLNPSPSGQQTPQTSNATPTPTPPAAPDLIPYVPGIPAFEQWYQGTPTAQNLSVDAGLSTIPFIGGALEILHQNMEPGGFNGW